VIALPTKNSCEAERETLIAISKPNSESGDRPTSATAITLSTKSSFESEGEMLVDCDRQIKL
jgi:hypothetical protein